MSEILLQFISEFADVANIDPTVLGIFGFFTVVLLFKTICSLINSLTNIWR